MGSLSEPVRKYDVQKWNSAWDRIRAKQAADKLEAAAAAELQEGGETPPTDEEG